MKRMVKTLAILLLALFLLQPYRVLADDRSDTPDDEPVAESSAPEEQESEEDGQQPEIIINEDLRKQIRDTYAASIKRSRRRSFSGYCGAYVAHQLVVLGINTSYISANGKNTFDLYENMDLTSGGYRITAYSAKEYTLLEALTKIIEEDPEARNILVGFQKGTTRAGKKYGHVLLIHGIINKRIYYSDSSSRKLDGIKYREGQPIVCSLTSFVKEYDKYKLDGVIHFQKAEIPGTPPFNIEETIVFKPGKFRAVY